LFVVTFSTTAHQYIDRADGQVLNEILLSDRHVRWLYSDLRESAPRVFRWLTHSSRVNALLANINFDKPFLHSGGRLSELLSRAQIDLSELAESLPAHPSWREVFGRKIRYWDLRLLPPDPRAICSPCDAKLLIGTLTPNTTLSIKGKFFDLDDLLGENGNWRQQFVDGSWALFRLTPEQYHFNHCPVTGLVEDFYEMGSAYHSCNPTASIELVTPLSKNRRAITIINTNCLGGTQIGRVAMIEVSALLIGKIRQAYSSQKYGIPSPVQAGLFLKRGAVKSEFMPGSSSVVLLFESNRIRFDEDLMRNQCRGDVQSRFSNGFEQNMVETKVSVRSQIATPILSGASK
jgi:phosphatidylserine decarboxylase